MGQPALILSLNLLVSVGVFIEHLLYAWSCHNGWEHIK